MRTARQIRLLANVLDEQGKADAPIVCIGTRQNIMRDFKPEKRGEVLRVDGHEIQLIKRATEGELQNYDWIDA
jgi:hypothetical protein